MILEWPASILLAQDGLKVSMESVLTNEIKRSLLEKYLLTLKRPQESTAFSFFWKEVKVSPLKLRQPSCYQPEDEDRRRRRSGEIWRETDPGPWHTMPEARQHLQWE